MSQTETYPKANRNEPCPCGSGKKYKRCHGFVAAPESATPIAPAATQSSMNPMAAMGGMPGMPPGMDQMDPAMMMKFTQALQRLPRGQMQRLQAMVQRAMAGRDVTREAQEFERTLPPEFKDLLKGFGGMGGDDAIEVPSSPAPTRDFLSKSQAPTLPAEFANARPSFGAGAGEMTPEQARAIVEKAAQDGKISTEQASELLHAASESEETSGGGLKKFFKGFGKKK